MSGDALIKKWLSNPESMKSDLFGTAPETQEQAEDKADPYVRKPWYRTERTRQIRDQKFEEFQQAMKDRKSVV